MSDNQPLWVPTPQAIAASQMSAFLGFVNERFDLTLSDSSALHAYSIEKSGNFWDAWWDFSGVISKSKGNIVLHNGDKMPGASFFPEARLNFAQNLLRRQDETESIVFWGENKVQRRMSWRELNELVSVLQQFLRANDIKAGDRVAAMMPNMPETIASMLACASIGAIFSSCSPDFGERGVLDRFAQIEPKIFIVCDGVWYNGKRIALGERLNGIIKNLPTLKRVLIVPYIYERMNLPNAVALPEVLSSYKAKAVEYNMLPFAHPLYILFSSGTTGMPKCIVHSAGGTLLQHLKEHRLHCNLRAGERFFYFTTCGWMMWNWLASGLASEATLLLYDGSPFYPNERILFDYADAEKMTAFGTSAKYIDGVKKSGWEPKTTHDLSSLKLIASTGSPLAAESFDFVYRSIKSDLHLASISGGTDIVSCFVGGDPTKPVYRGEIQAPGLGMAVDIYDENGAPADIGVKGELVCTKPFPCMPIGFWNDPAGEKYGKAYFERFPGIWCHGDFAEWTEHGGIIIHGRSDATLKPGGVRIGTAEIYAQVEQIPEVLESLCVGQEFDNDVRIVLFVRLKEGARLDEDLKVKIRSQIRLGASPRHVPAKILSVADIPRTKSGKIVELAVRDIVHGQRVKNVEALANPEALKLFANLPELQD
jgi:acetoacetyl-CoA synthetase